ncbi:MAG: restriction endonuclease subunit S [Selenomonas sp.]|uniref:restriction endonuclease subunit S n=1 Tax=Selenomonas sp. TaxID=2053611 RepID=UPI0025F7B6CD|nr:restriction endonuclease subunit S [Selenomonas sp.]MCI6231928.1 restriction endonuclease subunit S [Selenomonas sp.]
MPRLDQLCNIQYGYAFNADLFTTKSSQGVPLVRIRDVVRGYTETYTPESFSEAYRVHDGDILIGMDGEFNVARWHGGDAALNQRVCKITPRNNIHSQYLFYFLPQALKRIEDQTPFVTVKHLSAKKLSAIEVPDISMMEQANIAERLDIITTLLANRRQVDEQLAELPKARFVEMFGDLAFNPHGWKSIPIADLCAASDDIKCGPFGTQLSQSEYITSGVPVWGIPQVNANFQLPTKDFITSEKAKKLSSYTLIPGDIVMSRKGNVGRCAVYPQNFPFGILHSDVLRIRVNREVCDPTFLMQQLHDSRVVQTQIEVISNGAIMAGLNVTKLKSLCVHLPPLPAQRRFAAFARACAAQRAACAHQIAVLETLRGKLLQDAFGAAG